MTSVRTIVLLLIAIMHAIVASGEVKGRLWDPLSEPAKVNKVASADLLTKEEIAALGGRQIPLCMIGDSITWAQEGDCWRDEIVKRVPEVAFVGTHTGRLGYSHAGEGGDSTYGVLARLKDCSRIPDSPYYHLMIGANDSSAAKTADSVVDVASNTVNRIWRIIDELLARPMTRKVYLGAILPIKDPRNDYRDVAGSAANKIMRQEIGARYDSNRVVWVEYEKPLRVDLSSWFGEYKTFIHPRRAGYSRIAEIFAPIIAKEKLGTGVDKDKVFGVAVENLWQLDIARTRQLIPGWYICSFSAPATNKALKIHLRNLTEKAKCVFDKTFIVNINENGCGEFEFMTGYQGYGYERSEFVLEAHDDSNVAMDITHIQFEKMRPSRRASSYGVGTFLDTSSQVSIGELLQFH